MSNSKETQLSTDSKEIADSKEVQTPINKNSQRLPLTKEEIKNIFYELIPNHINELKESAEIKYFQIEEKIKELGQKDEIKELKIGNKMNIYIFTNKLYSLDFLYNFRNEKESYIQFLNIDYNDDDDDKKLYNQLYFTLEINKKSVYLMIKKIIILIMFCIYKYS